MRTISETRCKSFVTKILFVESRHLLKCLSTSPSSTFTDQHPRSSQLPSTQDYSDTELYFNRRNTFLTMAEAFLHELLQPQNSVNNPDERCSICLEGYGSLSRETGSIEIEIRLPCTHTVGSACIVTWLKTNNTCPICRHEFFPAQPRPYLEHGIMEDEESDDEQEIQPDLSNFRELNEDFCVQLDLDMEITMLSESIVQRLTESPDWSSGHNVWCVVTLGIYIASYLTGEPRSPREISAITGVGADHIRRSFDYIYPDRESLADEELRSQLEDIVDVASLRWPAPFNEVNDQQIEDNRVLTFLRDGCRQCCNEVGMDDKEVDLSSRIAERIWREDAIGDLPGPSAGKSHSRAIVAVSVFMASHLVSRPITARQIAKAIVLSDVDVQTAYRHVYDLRDELVRGAWFEYQDEEIWESDLERLPSP